MHAGPAARRRIQLTTHQEPVLLCMFASPTSSTRDRRHARSHSQAMSMPQNTTGAFLLEDGTGFAARTADADYGPRSRAEITTMTAGNTAPAAASTAESAPTAPAVVEPAKP